ncbi:MAG: DUF1836 domain-containing protein [Lachnospiraceae bacterium]|jgi:hypothetical protein|nr:DUF1836 domain-containing protein [Lachnospiraceae bacterium]
MTSEEKKEYLERIIGRLKSIDYIKPSDIPNIDLYMDQVTTFMDEHLMSLKRHEEDKMLTKTMINNYTKNNLLPSPNKKKYSKDHMLLLIFIYYFKNILSISDIQEIIHPLAERYYDGKEELSLEDIYLEVFSMEKDLIAAMTKDILKKYQVSKGTFEQEEDPQKRKFLTDFSFICTLCFDVYVKKTIIENLLDGQLLRGTEGKEG